VAASLGETDWDHFKLQPQAHASYVRKYVQEESGPSSARILDFLAKRASRD
jgi:hypothetical protein